MRLFPFAVQVFALPHVSDEVAEDAGVVMVAAAAGRGGLPELAAANDATESLTPGITRGGGAAPKRGAISFGQTTT